MTIQRMPPHEEVNLQFMQNLGNHVLQVKHEDDFVQYLAEDMRAHVGADVVVVKVLSDNELQTRAVATKNSVRLLAPDKAVEPFGSQDRQQWLVMLEIAFVPDIAASSLVKSPYKELALQLGIESQLIVPMVANGEVLGHIVFGWFQQPDVQSIDRQQLRHLVDVAALHFTFLSLRLARHRDPLTGLLNRTALEQRWPSDAQMPAGALFFMDLDSFKAFNDAHGKTAGDDYLRQVAATLDEIKPSVAELYRFGGDDFVLFVPGFDVAKSEKLISEIEERLAQLDNTVPPPRPSMSIAVAHLPTDGDKLQHLLRLVDERMYKLKRRQAQRSLHINADPDQIALPEGAPQGWLETWPDGVLLTDANYKVIYVNKAYEEMSGYTLEEWLGKTPGFIASGKTGPNTYRAMWHTIQMKGAWSGQLINRRRDGTEWVSYLSITRITSPDGRIVGYLGNARDISHSLWAGNTEMRSSFQEAFTQEALAFALAEAGQMHEGGSREHLERIRDFTRLLVQGAADRNYEELQRFETRTAIILSSILHDIGKLAIPEGLLRKPGRLTPAEFNLIKTHTIAGEQLLRSPYLDRDFASPQSEFLSMAATIARSHHEWWDGSGYPDGLAGEEIPLAARIVGIADVYDALRSQRPYKHAWSHRDAVDYIAKGAGRQFDPDLVRIFLELADEFEEVSERTQDESRVRSGSRHNGQSAS